MARKDWDIQTITRLKKEIVAYNNLTILLFVLLSMFYMMIGGHISVYFGLCCLLVWMIALHSLYTLVTGNSLGTKTRKRVLAFDKDCLGKSRWKKKKMIEVISISILAIISTVIVMSVDFNAEKLDIYTFFPIIGAWLGYNVGEIFRIGNL